MYVHYFYGNRNSHINHISVAVRFKFITNVECLETYYSIIVQLLYNIYMITQLYDVHKLIFNAHLTKQIQN